MSAARVVRTERRRVNVMSNMVMSQMANPMYDESALEESSSKFGGISSKSARRTQKSGVVPVKVDMVTAGEVFRFERLLVVNQTFQVHTAVS